MSSVKSYREFVSSFISVQINDIQPDDDDRELLECLSRMEGSPQFKVQCLKDQGNELLRQGNFSDAAVWYNKPCDAFCFAVGAMDGLDPVATAELAVSITLNLANCALKLREFVVATDICSLVITHFPQNVKALFRRASAFMRLKRFADANLDLEKALLLEPKNKDILRELDVVKSHLAINSNGKRCIEVPPTVSIEERVVKRALPNNGAISLKAVPNNGNTIEDFHSCARPPMDGNGSCAVSVTLLWMVPF